MAELLAPSAVEGFYRAASVGLRVLDRRSTTRRTFGAEADARWAGFAGHLRTSDRLDLALRDAAVTWGPAFSASSVFQLAGLAPDEPFGPDWPGLVEDVARRIWREAEQLEAVRLEDGLGSVVSAWGIHPAAPPAVGTVAPATRFVVGGLAAILAAARAFGAGEHLSWADQVVVVATSPAERHLAGLVAVLIEARGPTRLVSPEDAARAGASPASLVREAGLSGVDQVLLSDDVEGAVRDFANAARDARG